MTHQRDTATTVTEALREDHRDIARLLQVLERQIDIFGGAETPDYDIIVGVADYFLQYPDRCHHPKEDLIVDTLKAHHPEAVGGMGDLIAEHLDLHERAVRFRRVMGDLLIGADVPRSAIVDVARGFIATQYRHMREEEDLLYPIAERVLTPVEWTDIEDRLSQRENRLDGPWMDEMFRAAGARLLAWQAEDARAAS